MAKVRRRRSEGEAAFVRALVIAEALVSGKTLTARDMMKLGGVSKATSKRDFLRCEHALLPLGYELVEVESVRGPRAKAIRKRSGEDRRG